MWFFSSDLILSTMDIPGIEDIIFKAKTKMFMSLTAMSKDSAEDVPLNHT